MEDSRGRLARVTIRAGHISAPALELRLAAAGGGASREHLPAGADSLLLRPIIATPRNHHVAPLRRLAAAATTSGAK